MARWSVRFTFEGEEDLGKLDTEIKERVVDKIKWLRDNFDTITALPLGYEWQGFFKLRVGNWRVVYEIDYSKREIVVHYIDRRDKIYKKRRR